jgi:hypothetical protein
MSYLRPVRLAYQPPASDTFLSNKPAPAISHQPNEQAVDLHPYYNVL